MVAGIAHEINNPVNFIFGNITPATEYVKNLLNIIENYQQEYPNPSPIIQDAIEDLDLDFIADDLQKLLGSMKEGAQRIRDIVLCLRTFSRLDEAEMKAVDINEGLDSTLRILQHRFTETNSRPEIEIIKEYGELPLVNCYASQLNQVFMHILNNAVDALEKHQEPCIKISASLTNYNYVKIIIADNGVGMTEEVMKNIFNPFFTTKQVGSGRGLGLSVSYQIVVEKHSGKISCNSIPFEGTQLTIEIPMSIT
jgi:signal transduction histidine kinase